MSQNNDNSHILNENDTTSKDFNNIQINNTNNDANILNKTEPNSPNDCCSSNDNNNSCNNNNIGEDGKVANDVGSVQCRLSHTEIFDGDLDENNRLATEEQNLQSTFDEIERLGGEIDVLIMSEAGKPIYCYSGRKDVITLMGVCVALVNYVIGTQNDQLKSIHTRTGLHINFSIRSPLVIVVVCRQHSCFDEQTLINQINAQIISTITLKALKLVFQQAPTYDLKRLIHHNEIKTMDILVQSITTPIADLFTTFRNFHQKPNSSLFNNVISFYTSTSIAAPRATASNNSQLPLFGSNQNNSMMVLQDHKPNVLSRVYVPIAIIPVGFREQITTIINNSVTSFSDIVFSIMFLIDKDQDGECGRNENYSNHPSNTFSSSDEEFADALDELSIESDAQSSAMNNNCSSKTADMSNTRTNTNLKLMTVCNHNSKFRINPLDIQLIYALIKASDSQLSSTESLWLPLCLSRIDPNRFLYAHISYISSKYCLVLLDVDHEDFEKCRQAKETIQFKLEQIRLTEPMTGLRSCISDLEQPHLQYICIQMPRHCIMWQASIQTEFSSLNYYLIERMQRSSLKTLWLNSSRHNCTLLGWHTATFQLYAQFDITVSQYEALETVQSFIKWFKKEEDKLIIRDS